MNTLSVKKLDNNATIPQRSTTGAAGYDLYSTSDYEISSGKTVVCATGISIAIPTGYFGKIEGRSSLACKGIITAGGVIDSDYRGGIGVILINTSGCTYTVKSGDRIAQIIFIKVEQPILEEVNELPPTSRNEGGFGSTGK